ncbi:diguanylate cyclase (GGDEF)-like protein [Paenibacillus phyllosphaerae]|uniref:Diguanylate cyclase (GGDEF)-like protein n=1 Tax=Paenibacillus phyllosphaerae TaxID=274593 RepID=A0A7W5FRW6_9BACL|nr:sensor domain-containing diguanylate cyclase [Paenibacillus phyllosphaerae]MBB3114434.1 diguanylate cyclase (GGDEF)-like protein [Paenibacillus phyllosphaerae]
MESTKSSECTICRDSLNESENAAWQHDIWCEREDVCESDESYVIHTVQRLFRMWLDELPQGKLKSGNLSVWSANGTLISAHEAQHMPIEDELSNLVRHTCDSMQYRIIDDNVIFPLPKRSATGCLGALVWSRSDSSADSEDVAELLQQTALYLKTLFYHERDRTFAKELLLRQQATEKQATQQELILRMGKRLHDQNDVSAVIHELLDYMVTNYPYAAFDLYLSQDFVKGDPRIKPLLIRNAAEDIYAQSFLEARPIAVHAPEGIVKLAIPMSGKQAVYGVIGAKLPADDWDDADFASFIHVCSTAGSAFENAKLFEQSNLLISELQMINELTMQLNQSLKLSEIFEFTMSELLRIFKADHCSVLQLNTEKDCFQFVATNSALFNRDSVPSDYGFAGIINKTREPIITSDYWNSKHVSSKIMDATDSRSLIASPIMDGPNLVGVIILTHRNPNYFSYDNYKLLQVLSTHIGLAISNASLHAEVRRMVITDNLTGLHARHYLNEKIQSNQRKDRCGSLVVVDIDHFKKVNDTYGHLVGDRILMQVSEVIMNSIRETDTAARWGGEELAVYLPQIRSEQAYMIAERIRSKVQHLTDPAVTVSCGISEWTFEDEKISVESLFHKADMALYEAKHNGRNQIIVAV